MNDPLIKMMRGFTPYREERYLDDEAGELSLVAITTIPWMEGLKPSQQDELLFFAYKYAEERFKRMLN